MFNTNNDLDVLAGTLYGLTLPDPGGVPDNWTQDALENVLQVIFNRSVDGTPLRVVCMAPNQFDCWDPKNPKRNKILTAYSSDKETWSAYEDLVRTALIGGNPNRINGAKNYYPLTSRVAPAWARPPAVVTWRDSLHAFVVTD